MQYVTGYMIANDYAIRDYLENYYRPNLRVKNHDGGTVLGPWFVDAADIEDVTQLELRTFVNGTLQHHGSTHDLVTDIPALIAYLSSSMTLGPGDVILTGTPEGIQRQCGRRSGLRNRRSGPSRQHDCIGRGLQPLLIDSTKGHSNANRTSDQR